VRPESLSGHFVSLILESKPLRSDESVCLQSDGGKNIPFVCIWKNYFLISIFVKANISVSVMKYLLQIVAINKATSQFEACLGFLFLLTPLFPFVPAEKQMEKVACSD